jgi:hypothetical protein
MDENRSMLRSGAAETLWHIVPFVPFPVEYENERQFSAATAGLSMHPPFRLVQSMTTGNYRPSFVLNSWGVWTFVFQQPVIGRCAVCKVTEEFSELVGNVFIHPACLELEIPADEIENILFSADLMTQKRS